MNPVIFDRVSFFIKKCQKCTIYLDGTFILLKINYLNEINRNFAPVNQQCR